MYATLAQSAALSLSADLLPAVSLFTSLSITSNPEASPVTAAKPTTRPA